LLPLVAPLLSGHSDVAIGTRLGSGAHVVRGTRREFISRAYNLLLRTTLRSGCTDAQCGFKAMRRHAAAELLPLVEDDEWFFDTEVLVTAQRIGLRIHEVPVDWVDGVDSRVQLLPTALKDLRGIWRLLGPAARRRARQHPARPTRPGSANHPGANQAANPVTTVTPATSIIDIGTGWRGGAEPQSTLVFADELLRFAGVGAVSTVAYVALFAALEPDLGSYTANAVAIVLCSVGNTAAHRGMAGTARLGLDRRQRMLTAAALVGVSAGFTTCALAATRAMGWTSLVPELCAVSIANAGAAVIRFGILRTWVFRPEFGTQLANGSGGQLGGTHKSRSTELTRTPS
jgi:putative flippase GtrA